MSLPSPALLAPGLPVDATRAALDRLAEPLRLRLSPEDMALLDLLVTLAANGAAGSAAAERPAPAREPSLAALLGATSWEEIRITVVDGFTVRIGCRRRAVLRTYQDLGLYGGHTRGPTRKWELLVAICEGHGTFAWRDFGTFHAASQAVSVLRRQLRDAFGIAGDPFFGWDGGWKARFFGSSEMGGE